MGDYDFILDNITWSYSSLESFHECKYGYYLNYIMRNRGSSGAFAEYGSLCHSILEKYLKGELLGFELLDEFQNNYYKEVSNNFPPIRGEQLYSKYLNQGVDYFSNDVVIDSLYNDYDILGVEDRNIFTIDKYTFVGIIDYEAKNKNGEFEIIDHKSKSKQDKTRLTKKHNKEDWIQIEDGRYVPFKLLIQLYLYSIPFKEKFGEYPTYLNLNMFRINDWYKVKFNEKDFERAKQWAIDTIHDIYNETEWGTTKESDNFFCQYLCGVSPFCKYSSKYIGEINE